jgi:hypothetical protein
MSQFPDYTSEVSPRDASYETFGDDLFQLTLSKENKAEIFEYRVCARDEPIRVTSHPNTPTDYAKMRLYSHIQ